MDAHEEIRDNVEDKWLSYQNQALKVYNKKVSVGPNQPINPDPCANYIVHLLGRLGEVVRGNCHDGVPSKLHKDAIKGVEKDCTGSLMSK